jgi:glycerophosphoryl diester phosphodiesterase
MFGDAEIKAAKIMDKAKKVGTTYIGPFSFQGENLSDEAKYNLSNSIDPGELVLALDSKTIKILHENGYIIDAWTVDSVENIRDLIKSNVDILTTNYLEQAITAKRDIINK